ncbi:ferredoxin reductase family protein [Cellulomonas soli]|uniref:ferredoxin reductase family protein n=1 Tax=Cellulomonas soli TaxID=931535 RepID=UPI003F86CEE3
MTTTTARPGATPASRAPRTTRLDATARTAAGTRRGADPARPVRLRPPLRRAWWPDAVGMFTWGTLLVVTALWVANSGLQDVLAGPAAALSSLGRLTGLWASNLLLLQVLGMARVPVIERAYGADRLAKWHRWVGFSSFHLLLVHIVTLVLAENLYTGTGVVQSAWSMALTYPGMLLAWAGTLMITMVVVLSMRAARRRLRYESWHLLHLYAYLGVGLALPHQLWTGSDLTAQPWAAAYWWGLYGAVLVCVLVYRVGAPLLLSARHRFEVVSVTPAGRGTVTVHITGRHLSRLRVEAGQYFTWRFLTGPGWTRGHPLSLSAAPTTAGLRVTIGVDGDDGERIASMRPGTRVLVEGPYGRMVSSARTRPRIAAFAAGTGVAPVMALLHDHAATSRTTGPDTLVQRLSDEQDGSLLQDAAWLADQYGLRHVTLVGRRSRTGTSWLPEQYGHVAGPQAVRHLIPDLDEHDVFVCGPDGWADAVVTDLRAAGVPDSAIHLERYTW